MMMQDSGALLARMQPGEWPELYRLMVAQRFPAVPPDYADAAPLFAAATLLALRQGSSLQTAFVFGVPEDGCAFLDVVCAPAQHGRWATPAVLRELYGIAFASAEDGGLGLRCVWVQPHSKRALKACLQAGFVWPQGSRDVLVMTVHGVPGRFRQVTRVKEEDAWEAYSGAAA